jgi:hypothetical protein
MSAAAARLRVHCFASSSARAYLHDFADAVKGGDAKTAEQRILAKFPDYHVRQLMTVFSIPAFFPSAPST